MPKLHEKSVFQWFVAAVDGLFTKTKALTARYTTYVIAYYSSSKCGYDINVQVMYTADYCFCALSAHHPDPRSTIHDRLDGMGNVFPLRGYQLSTVRIPHNR